eukprot:1159973-Pelagomonas_calceolata.AAC.1
MSHALPSRRQRQKRRTPAGVVEHGDLGEGWARWQQHHWRQRLAVWLRAHGVREGKVARLA